MGVTSKSSAKTSTVFTILLAVVLALLAVPAWALGLGQLKVKSAPGQPLVAEIPIISNDPSELENLQARLASPETFSRVGLQPPNSEVQGLQFSVALDGRGNPVIRVTSAAPLRQPQLTFLLEVDWGDGRLVREYSALVDVPRTVAAPVQPVQAPWWRLPIRSCGRRRWPPIHRNRRRRRLQRIRQRQHPLPQYRRPRHRHLPRRPGHRTVPSRQPRQHRGQWLPRRRHRGRPSRVITGCGPGTP